MTKTTMTILLAGALSWPALLANDKDEKEAIQQVIRDAYVQGVHANRDAEAMRKGFHPAFVMQVRRNDTEISSVSLEAWAGRIDQSRQEHPDAPKRDIRHEFTLLEVTGNAAMARVELHIDGKHVFTDYMSLYKFDDGWKLVAKIFQSHQ